MQVIGRNARRRCVGAARSKVDNHACSTCGHTHGRHPRVSVLVFAAHCAASKTNGSTRCSRRRSETVPVSFASREMSAKLWSLILNIDYKTAQHTSFIRDRHVIDSDTHRLHTVALSRYATSIVTLVVPHAPDDVATSGRHW